jgi:hypothetical protein
MLALVAGVVAAGTGVECCWVAHKRDDYNMPKIGGPIHCSGSLRRAARAPPNHQTDRVTPSAPTTPEQQTALLPRQPLDQQVGCFIGREKARTSGEESSAGAGGSADRVEKSTGGVQYVICRAPPRNLEMSQKLSVLQIFRPRDATKTCVGG